MSDVILRYERLVNVYKFRVTPGLQMRGPDR